MILFSEIALATYATSFRKITKNTKGGTSKKTIAKT